MIEFKLPDLGEGVQEGEITKWLVKAGDTVREDQSLLEVMTDKVTAEIPSPYDGVVVDLLAPEAAVVPAGTPLLTVEEEGSDADGNGDEARSPGEDGPHAQNGGQRTAGESNVTSLADDRRPGAGRGRSTTAGGGRSAASQSPAAG